MKRALGVAVALSFFALACSGPTGPAGPAGTSTGSIAGVVKDAAGAVLAGVDIQTDPPSPGATSAANGTFSISNIAIGAYTLTATKAGYAPFALAAVGVVSNGTTNVSLVMQVAASAPGTIAGTVKDATSAAAGVGGVAVTVAGTSATATTAPDGTFTLSSVPPGPVFLSAKAPSAAYLDGETREAIFVPPGGSITGASIVLSARPSDAARYVGMQASPGCAACHPAVATTLQGAAHNRSLTRIQRNPPGGPAVAGAFARMLNATLKTPRTVMVPLQGTIAVPAGAVVTGTGTLFSSGGPGVALAPCSLLTLPGSTMSPLSQLAL